jgi:hypothetical protein
MVTKEAFHDWKRSEVTQVLTAFIRADIEEFKNNWADGNFGLDSGIENAYNLGAVSTLQSVLAALENGTNLVEVEAE